MASLAENLRLLRKERHLSIRELAEKLGISHSSIGMYEQGRREPNYETLEKIADFFNVDMDFLLGRTDIRNSFEWGLECERITQLINELDAFKIYLSSIGWRTEEVEDTGYYDDISGDLEEQKYSLSNGGLAIVITEEELQNMNKTLKDSINSIIFSLVNKKIS